MRYNKIRKMDISNGPGVRVSIFEQGCSFNCKNCFSPEPKENTAKSKENDELNSYRIFSYQSKGEKKNNKYAIKQF